MRQITVRTENQIPWGRSKFCPPCLLHFPSFFFFVVLFITLYSFLVLLHLILVLCLMSPYQAFIFCSSVGCLLGPRALFLFLSFLVLIHWSQDQRPCIKIYSLRNPSLIRLHLSAFCTCRPPPDRAAVFLLWALTCILDAPFVILRIHSTIFFNILSNDFFSNICYFPTFFSFLFGDG